MFMRETDVIELPAYWARALINDDYSRLSEQEAERCMRKAAAQREGWSVVGCFTWHYQLYDTGAEYFGGDVIDQGSTGVPTLSLSRKQKQIDDASPCGSRSACTSAKLGKEVS